MKIYKSKNRLIIEHLTEYYTLQISDFDSLINTDDLASFILAEIKNKKPERLKFENINLEAPIGSQCIWAAGVTYQRSRDARISESEASGGSYFYDKVYNESRPELFFKATPDMVSGPDEIAYIRRDAKWSVPEPELTLVINNKGTIIGYTIGNDISSRDIEGENPLYLPQAKSYERSACIGPCIYIPENTISLDTKISMMIRRKKDIVFEGNTFLNRMKRNFEELRDWLLLENTFKNGVYLMTGTGIIPPDSFSLTPGDIVSIEIQDIGILTNVITHNIHK